MRVVDAQHERTCVQRRQERVTRLSQQLERGCCACFLGRQQVRKRTERDRLCDRRRGRSSRRPTDLLRRSYTFRDKACLSNAGRPGHDQPPRSAFAIKALLQERELLSSSDDWPRQRRARQESALDQATRALLLPAQRASPINGDSNVRHPRRQSSPAASRQGPIVLQQERDPLLIVRPDTSSPAKLPLAGILGQSLGHRIGPRGEILRLSGQRKCPMCRHI